jgi:hypothetical protein
MTDEMALLRSSISRVMDSAQHLGIELNEQEAEQWIAAMSAESKGGDVVVDVDTGMFGHRAVMLDLAPADMARFQKIAPIVGFQDRPGVQTALALSGSAAQSKIQAFPADADFFERIHIKAPTREEACRILGEMMREKALSTMSGPTHRLWAVKLGSWEFDGTKDGKDFRKGFWVEWTPAEVESGEMTVSAADGTARTLKWSDAAQNPGWCKLDWVVADPQRGQLANASNVLDPTWEGPDGKIVPLDGFLEPYFQEVYLDTEARPLFDRLIKELSTDAVDDYVKALEGEVYKYSVKHESWGKVARRMYNIFRLTGRYAEAAYIRELFDEPTAAMYQVAALVKTLEEASEGVTPFDREMLVKQTDQLIMSAITALEGGEEAEVVSKLLILRDRVSGRLPLDTEEEAERLVEEAMAAVNNYFHRRLVALPEIAAYLDEIVARGQQH